ncbi:ribonucleotide-diphosphate reductase subunit beta [Cohnella kolymensis]|uniref:Ribonucleoside-diphosphate reductase subunit beta n=1 Tax=Cohnella kolymensis TaxID=1590652 RepID=A0ABR5A229_9BACL|nr:ribonucleotide-diphosphate reductase subunit beta [Cohnella kolymensis]KIL35104.1 ribonucleotide-diphosphate reductase subunit beta [Cohnella kolymensis]KIL36513.1 ribonucleotide-diphosphate reductase subunit beta [Cohnella kolymensis]
MQTLNPKALFNPDADTRESGRTLIGGETTNLMMLSNNKYRWSFPLYKTMMQNFWIPEEISLGQDKLHYDRLEPAERETFDKVISFLVFLDSLQTVNLPNINEYVTLPEVNLLLNIQTYQEALHSQSYGYILESIVGAQRQREIYEIAIKDPYLLRRNRYIADCYQEFIDEQTEKGFAKVMMANYILEGIYFYAGFSFFYNLARFGKMTGVGTEIKYINRDELTHLALFQNMFRELRSECPGIFTPAFEEELRDMMRRAVAHEIEWGEYAFGDRIQGLNSGLIRDYIRYLSNFRLEAIGLTPLYPEEVEDPLPFIRQFTQFNQTKTDFFEEKVINYAKGGSDLDLDALDDFEL